MEYIGRVGPSWRYQCNRGTKRLTAMIRVISTDLLSIKRKTPVIPKLILLLSGIILELYTAGRDKREA